MRGKGTIMPNQFITPEEHAQQMIKKMKEIVKILIPDEKGQDPKEMNSKQKELNTKAFQQFYKRRWNKRT